MQLAFTDAMNSYNELASKAIELVPASVRSTEQISRRAETFASELQKEKSVIHACSSSSQEISELEKLEKQRVVYVSARDALKNLTKASSLFEEASVNNNNGDYPNVFILFVLTF